MDGELDLANDVKAVAEEEVVIPMDAAAERVLDRKNGAVGDPELDGLEGDLELVAGDGLAVGVGLPGGGLAVGPGDALVRDAERGAVHRGGGEVGDGEGFGEVGDGHEIQSCRRQWLVAVDDDVIDFGVRFVVVVDIAGEDGAVALPVGAVGADGAVEEGGGGGVAVVVGGGGVGAMDASDLAGSDPDEGSGGGVGRRRED